MTWNERLHHLFKRNVAYDLAIEQMYSPVGYYLCKHTIVEQYDQLTPIEKTRLLEKIAEQIERTELEGDADAKQDWLQLERELSAN